MTNQTLVELVAKWRRIGHGRLEHDDYYDGQCWQARKCADELEAALARAAQGETGDSQCPPSTPSDEAVPIETERELMQCAVSNGRISLHYLRDLWLRGRRAGMGGFDFRAHLQRQREFSERTFGPGRRTKGVIQHIRKELKEIAQNPSDISEWIDVVILALDGAWRSGHSPDEIIGALAAKQAKNEARQWPDWRTADPEAAIEHVRYGEAQDATGGKA